MPKRSRKTKTQRRTRGSRNKSSLLKELKLKMDKEKELCTITLNQCKETLSRPSGDNCDAITKKCDTERATLIDQHENYIRKISSDKNELETQLVSQKEEILRLIREKEEALRLANEKTDVIKQCTSDLLQSRTDAQQLQTDGKEMARQLDLCANRETQCLAEKSALLKEKETYENEIRTLRAQIQSCEEKLAESRTVKEARIKLEDEKKALTERIEELQKTYKDNIDKQTQVHNANIQELNTRVQSLQKEAQAQLASFQDQEQTIKEYQVQLAKSTSSIKEKTAIEERLSQLNKDLESRLETFMKELEQRNTELQRQTILISTKSKELEKCNKAVVVKTEEMTEEINKCKATTSELDKKLQTATKSAADARQAEEKARAASEKAIAEKAAADKAVSDARVALEKAEAEKDAANKAVAAAKKAEAEKAEADKKQKAADLAANLGFK